MPFFRFFTLVVVFSLFASGCYQSSLPNKTAGFVGDYSKLEPLNNDIRTLFYQNRHAPWDHYHSILIHPVQVFFIDEAKDRNLDPDDLETLSEYFTTEMVNAVKGKYHIATTPGPGVLRLRAAITDAKPTNVVANIVSKTLFYLPVDMGEAAMEGELRDSSSGELVAAIVDRKIGSLLSTSLGYTKWGHIKDAFREWAKQLRQVLDEQYKPDADG